VVLCYMTFTALGDADRAPPADEPLVPAARALGRLHVATHTTPPEAQPALILLGAKQLDQHVLAGCVVRAGVGFERRVQDAGALLAGGVDRPLVAAIDAEPRDPNDAGSRSGTGFPTPPFAR
jgi:hypothetical protein